MTVIWCMVPETWSAMDRIFCDFGPFFALLPQLTTQKIKFLKKWKKNTWGYYHFTQVYHKWQSYDELLMRYEAWRIEFFVILDCLCPFTPLKTQKIKILKKWKQHLEISSVYTSVPRIMIICYTVPNIWRVTD